MKVQRDGRSFTADVAADGEGLVSRAGSALLAWMADRLGLTAALSEGLSDIRERRGRHDPGRVVRDLAVTLADGGECLADLGAGRGPHPLRQGDGHAQPAVLGLPDERGLAGVGADRPGSPRLGQRAAHARRPRQPEAQAAAPPRFAYAGRLAFSGRRAVLRLPRNWPWATELLAAFERLALLPEPAG